MAECMYGVHTGTQSPLQRTRRSPMFAVSFGTMDINALVISGSDPGAVPGVSTKHPSFEGYGDEIGSTNV